MGLSRNPNSFSQKACAFLKTRGYKILPVNPKTDIIEGQACYDSVESLPDVQAAIFFTNPRVTEEILPRCKAKGITHVWFQRGSADPSVFKRAETLGLNYKNSCVFLHHPNAGFPHNLHRFIERVFKIEQWLDRI